MDSRDGINLGPPHTPGKGRDNITMDSLLAMLVENIANIENIYTNAKNQNVII